ncbi:MAG: alkaline phosphatase family protein [Candidatus Aminicenantes bacterium]|nr:alkaline phosphatase family protein [Candidatus Aminicenantes bacterium]
MNERIETASRRETRRRSFRVLAALLGGAIPGWLVGVLPYIPFGGASELLSSRAYLVELMFLVLAKGFPIPALRWLRGPAAILLLFTVAGAVLGLSSFLFLRTDAGPKRQFTTAVSTSATALIFLLLAPFLKALFFYPARAMLSLKGALLFAGALLVSALAGALIYVLLKALRTTGHVLLVLVLVLSIAFVIVPSRHAPSPAAGFVPRRVVLIGVDAASWNVLHALIRQGCLPHLERFVNAGARGSLRATLPVRSPAIWTTIATGQTSARHGVRDYVIRDPETGELLPISISARKVPALWDITSRAGKATDVVAWYGSWPAEKVRGRFLSDRLGFRGLERRSEPPEAAVEFEVFVPSTEDAQFPPAALAEVATKLLQAGPPELFLISFRTLDAVQHQSWAAFDVRRGSPLASFLFRRIPSPVLDAGSSLVADAYAEVDRAVGAILEAAGGDATYLLVSDHGQGPARGPMTFSMSEVLERLGWLSFKPGTRDVDWSLTKLFDGTRDLKGRDLPRGLVPNIQPQSPFRKDDASGRGSTAVAEFMGQAVRALADLRTTKGRPLFTKVRLVPPRGSGPPRLDVWVDMGLEADDALLVGGTRLPVTAVVDKTRLTGMHRVEGVILAQGPGIRRGVRIKDAGVVDIAPTVLYLLDLPLGRDMEGRVLKEAIDPRLLAQRSMKWIPTHLSSAESESGAASGVTAASKAKSQLLDDLRSLGYIRAKPGRRPEQAPR